MRRITILFLLIMPWFSQATSYTSVTGGGNWSNSATWSPIGVPGSGDDVTIASAVTLDANESVNNFTINSSQTFTVSGSNTLSVYANFTNNGTFTYSTGLVSFLGSSNQTITGTVTFYDITVNPSSSSVSIILAHAITINDNLAISNGTLNCQNFNITGNATGTMTMGSGTNLILGLTTSSTLVNFPSSFTVGHTTLNKSSTVTYQANNTSTGQTVSATPAYGNLTVTTSKAGTSGGGGTTLIIRGNLTIGSGINFTQNDGTDSIKGNITVNSSATFTSYATNTYFTGSTFTNNGTYQENGSIFRFVGNTNEYVIGPTSIPINFHFNEIIINESSASDTTFVEGNISTYSSSTFEYFTPVFVPATYNDTIQVTRGFGNFATFTALNGVVYFNSPGVTQTFGGSVHPPTFYRVTSNDFPLEPLCTWTVTSDYTILSGGLECSGGGTLTLDGNFINNGSTIAVTGLVTMAGSSNTSIKGTTATRFQYLQINKSASTDTVKLAKNITTIFGLGITTGTLDVSTSNYSIMDSSYFTNDGTFVARNGTVTMYGSTTGESIGGTSTTTFYNLTQNNSTTITFGNNEIVKNNLLLSSGTLDVSTSNYSLTVGGNFTNNAAFTHRNGTVTLNGTAAQTIGGTTSTTFYNLTCSSAGSDAITLGNNESVSNNFLVSGGTFTLNGSTYGLNVAGSFTNNATLKATSGLVSLNGSASQTLGGTSPTTFYNLTLHDGHTVTLGNNQIVGGIDSIYSGTTLDVSTSNYNMSVAGNWVDNGTFTPRSGLVTFNANGTQCVKRPSGTESFKNMTIGTTSRLGSTCAINVSGIVTIQPGGRMDCSCP